MSMPPDLPAPARPASNARWWILVVGFPLVALDSAQYSGYLTGLREASASGDLTLVLGMVLDACRWLTHQVGTGIEGCVTERLQSRPDGRMPFAILLAELAAELSGGAVLGRVVNDLQAKVADLLPTDRRARALVAGRLAGVGAGTADRRGD